jgi:ATP-binding cassette subfamily B protein
LFYTAFAQGQKTMRASLSSVGMAYYNVLFLGDLFRYLDLRPGVVDPEEPFPFPNNDGGMGVDVAFRGVTFRYPGGHADALHSLDLHVQAGQVAAVVGANGAGKSTLAKLLCRLYDPVEGAVELGGVNLRRLRVEDVRDAVTVLFQSPTRYDDSVARNIDVADEASRAEIEHAARAADAADLVGALPQQYETVLGRWTEAGTDLSMGEWQRIAMARAILRKAPVLVFDEPTSAMDSWSEARWMDRLRTATRGCTTVVITHRFTTAMRADVIFVMEAGRVVECGNHDALVALRGRYAESWELNSRFPKTPAGATPRTPPPRPHSTS